MLRDLRNGADLAEFDALYIMGGNTFTLLHALRGTEFERVIKAAIDAGKVVYGVSAGAIVLGHDIQSAAFGEEADENEIGLQDYSALGTLSPYNIVTHYDETDESVRAFIEQSAEPILAIPEETGLAIKDDRAKVIGTADVQLFVPGSRTPFSPEKVFPLEYLN